MIFLNVVILVAGFVALVKEADIFVDGSSSLARIFKVPTLIIGLTIVACGTSMPELAVSTSASISGADEIALATLWAPTFLIFLEFMESALCFTGFRWIL